MGRPDRPTPMLTAGALHLQTCYNLQVRERVIRILTNSVTLVI